MIYELRTYELYGDGRQALHARFEEHTVRFFERHGFRVIGFWETEIGDGPELTYLLAWQNLAEREQGWDGFNTDPEWLEIRERTNREQGPMVWKTHSKILRPTRYSPMK